ncbi:hypothetical protein [Persephonella sp.]
MFIEIEENTFINSDAVVAVELITISSEPYGETYQWVFYTSSTGDKSVFHSQIFDSREEALRWFENIRFSLEKG